MTLVLVEGLTSLYNIIK
jgi:hypothetical protein